MSRMRQRAATIALALTAAAAGFAPAAVASTSPPANVGEISYTSHYWPGAVTSPTAMTAAWQSASAYASGGYCNSGVATQTVDGLSNQALCGANSNVISHVVVPFTTTAAGSWHFQIGPDYGNGSEMLVDGTVVQSRWYGIWAGGDYGNTSQIFDYTASLSAGRHTVEIYGAEPCCDGSWGARYQLTGAAAWTPLQTTVDSTAPVITAQVSPAGPDGMNGWYTSSPTVAFDVTDPDSAVTDTSGDCAGGAVSADTASTTFTCAATSAGGTATQSVTLKRDATAPAAKFDDAADGVVDGATYTWGSVPTAPTCTATDALSGPDGCTVSGYSTDVGTHTLVATATDKAGNIATSTRSYTVAPWRTSGFYQPVDMGGVFNTVKNGSTVPVKFTVYAGATKVTDPSKVTFSAAKVTCATGTVEGAVEVTSTGATSLRYDSTGGQFVYNWATPQTAGVCYALTMTTADGTATKALFKLK